MSEEKQKDEFGARVVLVLADKFAKAVNDNGLEYADCEEDFTEEETVALNGLQEAMAQLKGTLTNAMRDFEYYVQSSDAHGTPANPMLDWSRDAIKNDRAKAYYQTKFVVTVRAGQKVFKSKAAEAIADCLRPLEGEGVVEKVRVDSADPAKNPPIPQKYFDAQP